MESLDRDDATKAGVLTVGDVSRAGSQGPGSARG